MPSIFENCYKSTIIWNTTNTSYGRVTFDSDTGSYKYYEDIEPEPPKPKYYSFYCEKCGLEMRIFKDCVEISADFVPHNCHHCNCKFFENFREDTRKNVLCFFGKTEELEPAPVEPLPEEDQVF